MDAERWAVVPVLQKRFVQLDQNLRNVIDFVVLPGFNNPTLAMPFQTERTWTGCALSLANLIHHIHILSAITDITKVVIDIAAQLYPILQHHRICGSIFSTGRSSR